MALYAIRDTELESRLDGLVCLSTPFLHVSSRDGALYESFYRTLCWVLIPILCFLLILLLRHVTRLSVPMAVAGAAVVGLLLLFCVRKYVSAKHKLLAKKVQGELSLPDLTCTRLLVIRAGGDEASGLLVSLQFMTWLLGYMWAIVVAFSQGFQSSFERFKQRLSSAMTQIAAGAILIALLLWLSSYEDIFHFEWSTIVIGLVVFISGFQILLQTPLLALALWQHILGFVSMPLVVIVGTLLSPFGPELVWSSILLEITAEATPPGAWRIYQLPASATSSQPGLKHSMTYTDTLALAAISDWLLNTEPRVAATNVRGA